MHIAIFTPGVRKSCTNIQPLFGWETLEELLMREELNSSDFFEFFSGFLGGKTGRAQQIITFQPYPRSAVDDVNLDPPADAPSVLCVLVTMRPGKKFLFEPHLDLDQHASHDES